MLRFETKLAFYFLVSVFLFGFILSKPFAKDLYFEGSDGKEIVIKKTDIELISKRLEDEAMKESDLSKREILLSVAKNLNDGDKENSKKKKKLSLKKVGMAIGKGSTFVGVQTARPFIAMAGFFTGLFQKKDKDKEAYYFLKFLLNHEKEFRNIYKEASDIYDYADKMQEKVEEILAVKSANILHDALVTLGQPVEKCSVLKTMGVEPYASDKEVLGLEEVLDISKINAEDIKPELINEHKEYQELRMLLGDFDQEKIEDLILSGSFDLDFDEEKILEGARIKGYEGGVGLGSQVILPATILGSISSVAGGVIGGVTIAADLGLAVSASMCLFHKKTRDQIGVDRDITEFCSYVINKSAFVISRSRARGFVAGKNFREKISKIFKKKEK